MFLRATGANVLFPCCPVGPLGFVADKSVASVVYLGHNNDQASAHRPLHHWRDSWAFSRVYGPVDSVRNRMMCTIQSSRLHERKAHLNDADEG